MQDSFDHARAPLAPFWPNRAPPKEKLCYIGAKPKGSVPEKHLWFSGSNPHRQAGFCHAQIPGVGAHALPRYGFGRDGQKGNLRRTAEPVFFTSRPPAAMKTQTGVSLSRSGAKTMTTKHTTTGRTARTSDPVQHYADALNCASMARYYLRTGNIAAAKRKSVQALAAIARLQRMEGVDHAV